MRLYIAEKPSMGREIAACLTPPIVKHDGCLETKDGVVTWLFGHVLRQAEPQEYDPRYKRWAAEDLPIIPKEWKLLVDEKSAKQFNIVKNLIAKADEIVHAGDPDREGQLLVDEVLDYLGNKKPVRRILLNALDEKSIKKANANLRDNSEFFNLKQSALARARADWLIGMNLSRAYTLAARRAGHDKIVLPIGRVKTPTLSLVVRREREIENFTPVDYFTIKAEFSHENGSFTAQWKPGDLEPNLDSEGRLIDKAQAEKRLAEFAAEPKDGKITLYQKAQKKESAPLPFSLSSLQVLAGKRYGYAPQLVLDTAQKLYERKLTTYPRSDSEYLPLNQFDDAKTIIGNLAAGSDAELAAWAKDADTTLKSRAWNDKKISAHHAIIPTTVKVDLGKLAESERNIYKLIARNYIAQFYPLHVYDQTKIEVSYKDELFTASGRTEKIPGWKVMYQGANAAKDKDDEEKEDTALPPMKKNDTVTYKKGELMTRTTKPPQRFTASTLLSGMKEIHRYVKNPEAKKQLKDVYGIGTEATRATIIDDLIKRKFLKETGKKKYLVPQSSAYLLVDALPDEMTYPDSTAIWEDKLHSMSEGDGELGEFLAGQIEFTTKLCEKALGVKMEIKGDYPCPRCHNGVMVKRQGKNGAFWGCTNFPRCRMSCDDKDGKPDFESKKAAAPNNFVARDTGFSRQNYAPKNNYAAKDYAAEYASDEANAVYSYSASSEPPPEVFDMLGDPYASRSYQSFADKPKYSAAPMEKLAKENKLKPKEGEKKILCPHCKEGFLRKIQGRNGPFWGCSNYPRCTATFDEGDF